MKTEVALVLDTNFAHRLQILAFQMPVWIINSPVNTVIVKELRLQSDSFKLTEILSDQHETTLELFYKIIFSVDEHHNESSQDPPYDTLLVYGLDLEEIDKSVLRELSFIEFQKTEYGFIATKQGVNSPTD